VTDARRLRLIAPRIIQLSIASVFNIFCAQRIIVLDVNNVGEVTLEVTVKARRCRQRTEASQVQRPAEAGMGCSEER